MDRAIDIKNSLIAIDPLFTPPFLKDDTIPLYYRSMEELIQTILPQEWLEQAKEAQTPKALKEFYQKIEKSLPLVFTTEIPSPPCCFGFAVLCYADYTHGVGRFISDMVSRWLIPGKHLAITGSRSLAFVFKKKPNKKFYLCELHVSLEEEKDKLEVEKSMENFIKELKLNILSVYHARYIVSMKQLSLAQKSAIIQQNIENLLKGQEQDRSSNAFDHMQSFLNKLSAEKKISEVEKNLAYLMHKRPKTFDRDVFNAVNNMLYLFDDRFTAQRDPRHISRIIGFQYLFHKSIYQSLYQEANQRHISLKLLKTRLQNDKMVLGILLSLNFVNETERFGKNHILEAIWYSIEDVKYVEDSYISDNRDEKIRSYYLEIEKANSSNFSFEEIKILKKRLPSEIKNRIESGVHPIFMPRNEEEVLRNIILLSKQLKYVRDIPQIIISYEKQTGLYISFNVILLRLVKTHTASIRKLLAHDESSKLKFSIDEVKKVGYLKKKYPKEATIFRISLNKTTFFRDDKSLDLLKARQFVCRELLKAIGPFRDYNGGMIQKQSQALNEVKKILKEKGLQKYKLLLENYFYSLRPGVMQSILPIPIIITHFDMILEIMEKKEKILTKNSEEYFLAIFSSNEKVKNEFLIKIGKLKIPSFELTHFSLDTHLKKYLFGFIYKINNGRDYERLLAFVNTFKDGVFEKIKT